MRNLFFKTEFRQLTERLISGVSEQPYSNPNPYHNLNPNPDPNPKGADVMPRDELRAAEGYLRNIVIRLLMLHTK